MLKLVATDMDGTLLDDEKQFPEGTFDTIKRLQGRGIKFAVASGRAYMSLLKLYDELKDEIIIIGDNGAVVLDKGEVIYHDQMSAANLRLLVDEIRQIPETKINICGLKSAYLFEDEMDEMLESIINTYFPVVEIIKSIDDIPADESILKLAVFDGNNNAKKNIYGNLSHLSDLFEILPSGAEWADIMNKGMNKGKAIEKLQEMYAIAYEETMVFGDQMNDYDMLKQAYYSYAMDNAVDEIKQIANFRAPANTEAGVIRVLENFLAMTK